ncbi:hypothetical protein BDB00DRAFT_845305 [Zychaea mexicana]|uniref:uncharacterized protein n=1 Tax=Zychaea mexicana TaxID=64656 RepID=UPI0022FE3307|nr:uncharacterized protein BDB00DRAFT_845305 [Zychaea mexicana]KAI9489019.1 hypothetical protein BDB00DRAFT_845305 [Zychaea mexicana]
MQYHESMRVQRLLGMVYQFQMSTAHSEEALSAFCKQLQTYLESWADLKRDKRHVVRHTNMSILCNGRSSVVRSKRCRHIMDDHSRYRHQKQHQRSHDLEEPQPQNTFDALEPQIQQKLDSVKEPLLVRIRELELALKECERERSQVEQELNAVQNQFSQAQRPADSSAPPSTSSKDENDNDEESSEKVEEQSAFKVEHHNQLDTLMSVRPALTSERYADEQSREQERQAYHEARAMLTRTQTTIAELELRLEVANSLAKKQRQQQPLPTVVKCDCRQTIVAERDAQIQNLESTIQHYEGERQTWEQQAAARYFQEKEAFKVQVSRQVRELAGALAEQECQNDVLEKRRQEDALTISRMETLKRQAEEKCQKRLINWEAEEKSLRMTVATLEAKIVKLEQDSLVLYAKNLKLAHQLGQWAP